MRKINVASVAVLGSLVWLLANCGGGSGNSPGGTLPATSPSAATAPASSPATPSAKSSIVKIAAGTEHTCALTNAGGVKCWGGNSVGELGNNSTTNSVTPVDVVGLSSGVAAITAGDGHTCALTTAGGAKCWGDNSVGELGNNSISGSLTPVDVMGLASAVTAITAGNGHTCALTTAGGVKCWGTGSFGQLGNNSTTSSVTPVDVVGLSSGVTAITAGNGHTCALTTAGGVKCWGADSFGQLGNNSTAANIGTPVDVTGLASGVVAITAGGLHTCALTTTGGAKCWGDNSVGELGNNSSSSSFTPVDVVGLTSGVAAITAGDDYTCALTTAGGVKCWGANYAGQLGDNTTTSSFTPVDVTSLTGGVAAITAGTEHTCALTTAGGVKCWGENATGELGSNANNITLSVGGTGGTVKASTTPVDVVGL
jgi:alpha-tubulin suppressor-like RCC1 family protein